MNEHMTRIQKCYVCGKEFSRDKYGEETPVIRADKTKPGDLGKLLGITGTERQIIKPRAP